MKSAQNAGNNICGHKKCDDFEKYINSMSGNTLNLMCGEYEEDSDKCEKLPSLSKSTKFSKPPTIIVGFGQLLEDS
jgi:hypothetical protein